MLRVLTTALAVLALFAFAASADAASPGWKITAGTAPTHMPPSSSERQTVTGPFFGTFTLTFAGDTTTAIAPDAPATGPGSVQAALNALPSISAGGGGVSVVDAPSNGFVRSWIVIFDGGPLAGTDVPLMTSSGASVAPTPAGNIRIWLMNVGGAPTTGPITLTIGPFPDGVTTAGVHFDQDGLWACAPPGAGQNQLSCTFPRSVAPGKVPTTLVLPITVGPTAAPQSSVPLKVDGGGTLPDPAGNFEYDMPLTISSEPAGPGIAQWWAAAFDGDGRPMTAAGGHPHGAGTMFLWNTRTTPNGSPVVANDINDIAIELPPGFMGNPMVTPRCSRRQPHRTDPVEGVNLGLVTECPEEAELGTASVLVGSWKSSTFWTGGCPLCAVWHGEKPLTNVEPMEGYPAEFAFPTQTAYTRVGPVLRSDRDYGITADIPNVPIAQSVFGGGSFLFGSPPGADGKAFFTMGMNCAGEAQSTPQTTIFANTWQNPDVFDSMSYPAPAVTDCDELEFDPSFGFDPDTVVGASPSGATADLSVPQEGLTDPDELATPHLKRSVVSLPEGLVLNPSAANGLAACTTQQIGLKGTGFAEPNPIRFTKDDPSCPDGSKIGTVEVDTPLLEDELEGAVYLAKQVDNPFGSLIALYLVIDSDRYGIHVKLPGRVDADPQSGRLVATFDHNPQVPFSNLKLRFRGGPRGNLATPDVCGSYSTAGVWTPWSAPDSGPPAQTEDAFSVSQGCAASKGQRSFDLGLDAGSTGSAGGSFAPFSLRLTRRDGGQELDRIEASAPRGLLASLRGVPYCSEGAIAQATGRTALGTGVLEQVSPSCPEASRVGTTSVGSGVGSSPVFVGGKVYLAGPYKGAPLSLVVVVPAVAGPFDLGVQVVRTALHVDRSTAQVTAVSDTVPKILEGVPLAIQDVRVNLDRQGFTINPTSCEAKQIASTVAGANGASAGLSEPFHASGCSRLAFKPKLALRLTGRKQVTTGKHPGIRAQVNQTGVGEAGIERAEVRLPKSLALDPDNAQALCEFEAGTKPDLENHCPQGSIVGRAKAVSPLLKQPLAGNVYFVKNVRTDPKTGNQIRTLPMIIVALRGEVAINLRGESSTTRAGKLVNTFDEIPDAPITQFNLNIQGGQDGILAVTRTRRSLINLCTGRHVAEADIDGHNGRRHDLDIRMKTPCSKKQTKAAKRQAKRAAAKARRGGVGR